MKPVNASPSSAPANELVDAATERLIAHMAHELRTPISSALLWAKILNTPEAPPDAERLREGLDAIEQSIREQQAVVDGLIDMAEILSGRAQVAVHEIDPQPVLHRAVAALRPLATENGVQLELTIANGVGTVCADERRLYQAVTHLLENALKFTPSEGRIDVVLEPRGPEVEIRVMDTGQGIAPEFLPLLFDRFVPANPAVNRAQRGFGLGLLLTHRLIAMQDGSLTAQSAGAGQGATFVIRLPVAA
jgi:signal transduction histidine kinase